MNYAYPLIGNALIARVLLKHSYTIWDFKYKYTVFQIGANTPAIYQVSIYHFGQHAYVISARGMVTC
jgi:hypothetical protein